jgi:hypothetical protein
MVTTDIPLPTFLQHSVQSMQPEDGACAAQGLRRKCRATVNESREQYRIQISSVLSFKRLPVFLQFSDCMECAAGLYSLLSRLFREIFGMVEPS